MVTYQKLHGTVCKQKVMQEREILADKNNGWSSASSQSDYTRRFGKIAYCSAKLAGCKLLWTSFHDCF